MASSDSPPLVLGEGVEHAVMRVDGGQSVLRQLVIHHLDDLTHAVIIVGPVASNLRGEEGGRGQGTRREGREGRGEGRRRKGEQSYTRDLEFLLTDRRMMIMPTALTIHLPYSTCSLHRGSSALL